MSLCSKMKKVKTFLVRRMKSLREGWDEDEARRMKSNPEGWNHCRRKLSKPRFRHSATLIANVVELALLSIQTWNCFLKIKRPRNPTSRIHTFGRNDFAFTQSVLPSKYAKGQIKVTRALNLNEHIYRHSKTSHPHWYIEFSILTILECMGSLIWRIRNSKKVLSSNFKHAKIWGQIPMTYSRMYTTILTLTHPHRSGHCRRTPHCMYTHMIQACCCNWLAHCNHSLPGIR